MIFVRGDRTSENSGQLLVRCHEISDNLLKICDRMLTGIINR